MDFYTVDIKRYKAIFLQVEIANALAIAGSALLVNYGGYVLLGYYLANKLTLPVLSVVVILSVIHTRYQRKQLARLAGIENFDARVNVYEKFYRFRMFWYLFTCFISCMLSVLTGRFIFLLYALIDVLISLPFYPNLALFKRELKNEDIIFFDK